MVVTTTAECALCGDDGPRVRPALVHWARDDAWEAVPRCMDRTACAQRVRDAGDVWPLVERDTSILTVLGPAARMPAEPEPAIPSVPPAEDVRSWW